MGGVTLRGDTQAPQDHGSEQRMDHRAGADGEH